MKRYFLMLWFWLANKGSRRSVVNANSSVVVSLTSYDPRITRVFATIESIAAGRLKPRRLLLWLDDSFKHKPIPESLRRLEKRGLEILFCSDDGPHKKYRPYVLSQVKHLVPLVTADDDALYPHAWLDELVVSHLKDPEVIYCHRARVVQMKGTPSADQNWLSKEPSAYRTWPACKTVEPSLRHFSIGVSGVLYPPSFLNQLNDVSANSLFKELTPKADDVWLNCWGSYWGYKKQQVAPFAAQFLQIPLSGRSALHRDNVVKGENDTQIQAMVTYLSGLPGINKTTP